MDKKEMASLVFSMVQDQLALALGIMLADLSKDHGLSWNEFEQALTYADRLYREGGKKEREG